MTEFSIGIACFIVGYFAQQTVKGKMRLNHFFFTIIFIAILFCMAFEMTCLVKDTCGAFTFKVILIEAGGSFLLAAVCYLLLFCYRKKGKSKFI